MTAPTKQIRDYLMGIGGFWPIFIGSEPASPDSCITLYDTGGSYANQDARLSDPSIQIRVRTFVYPDGYDMCAAVRDALIVQPSFVVDDWLYTGAWITMDVAKIGRDDRDRELFTCNLRFMREQADILLATNTGALVTTSDDELIEVAA